MRHDPVDIHIRRHIAHKDVAGQSVRQHLVHVSSRVCGNERCLLVCLARMLLAVIMVMIRLRLLRLPTRMIVCLAIIIISSSISISPGATTALWLLLLLVL